ncbi:unnamed protein product [Owenia fusiformis]|uniref:Serine/threonine-protein kinase PLK n=1 Tax=Owenia fusiformis TaxID=6347 RepID=A0A8S4N3A2_OWEFU|nr:unnamed protein product [Owenia fusiformis]
MLSTVTKATRQVTLHVKDIVNDKGKMKNKENMKDPRIYDVKDPSAFIFNPTTSTTYMKGKLLGKGGFAKCYELTDLKTDKVYAGKIIAKTRISKPHQKEKIVREIELHRTLDHKHVVGFHSFFEDDENVYIILEKCSKKSLVHVMKNRSTITEPEVRYYIRRLVYGCQYIHSQHIIHRDLKLGNMLLNSNMDIKIGDFGLATKVDYEGEKKMTVCGTPNYIAPEVLQKKGHSYEADIWAIGCIMYALLVGRPPFETATLKETYNRITHNKYSIPPHLSLEAKKLIKALLSNNPEDRPTLEEIPLHPFFLSGFEPKHLSDSACVSAPKFPITSLISSNRQKSNADPANQDGVNKITSSLAVFRTQSSKKVLNSQTKVTRKPPQVPHKDPTYPAVNPAIHPAMHSTLSSNCNGVTTFNGTGNAVALCQVLEAFINNVRQDCPDNPSPLVQSNVLWVTKWVDYSNKYGFGYQLSDRTIGVLFNDGSRICRSPDGRSVHFNDMTGKLCGFTMDAPPSNMEKRTILLSYFAQYMEDNLIKGGHDDNMNMNENWCSNIFMKKWFRTSKAIVMYLNTGTLQINFFDDHTKVIITQTPHSEYLVTYIDQDRQSSTFRMAQLQYLGCSSEIVDRLSYSKEMLLNIIEIEGEEV